MYLLIIFQYEVLDLSVMQKQKEEILHISFNQDQTYFCIGTEKGFKVFKLAQQISEIFSRQFGAGIGIVQMIHKTNIMALVGGGKTPRYPKNKLMIWDDSQMKCIIETSCKSEVKAVKIKPERCVIVLQTKIFIFNLADFRVINSFQTCPNPKGLCTISSLSETLILAFPSKHIGNVQMISQKNASQKAFEAHKSTLCALQLCPNGYKIATASEKGTIIRIFNAYTTECLQQLRRGSQYATIYSIAFDIRSCWLACTSDSGTVHIFALKSTKQEGENQNQNRNKKSKFSILSKWSSYFDSEWSFASYHTSQKKTKVGFLSSNTIAIISTTGVTTIAQFNPQKGGECKKVIQYNILG